MLAVGRGLMSLPKLLMFDEPSLGLAPILVREIFNVIKKIREEGTTVLIVEQNVKQTLLLLTGLLCLKAAKWLCRAQGKSCSMTSMLKRHIWECKLEV